MAGRLTNFFAVILQAESVGKNGWLPGKFQLVSAK
jgi:hypothetical protein